MDGETNSRAMEVEFLGTGTSIGVPVPTCHCPVCRSEDPRNKRWRSSLLVRNGDRNLVVDLCPEFRLQSLRAGLDTLDAVLLTHAHADHINGLDDVRAFTLPLPGKKGILDAIPVWGLPDTLGSVARRFDYIWHTRQMGGGLPKIIMREIVPPAAFVAAGLTITPVPIKHGCLDILGYRIGNFIYLTDISAMPETSLPLLEGVEIMVASCAFREKHPTHFTLDDVIDLHRRVRPRQTYITHLTHAFDHQALSEELPAGIQPAHDGLRLAIRA